MASSNDEGNCSDTVDTSSADIKKALEELLRYILSRFLSVVVNHSFAKFCGGGTDTTDFPSSDQLETIEDWTVLLQNPEILNRVFSESAKYVSTSYRENVTHLYEQCRSQVDLENSVTLDVKGTMQQCILDWFLTDFQSAMSDLLPSQTILRVLEKSSPQLNAVIRTTHYLSYVSETMSVQV